MITRPSWTFKLWMHPAKFPDEAKQHSTPLLEAITKPSDWRTSIFEVKLVDIGISFDRKNFGNTSWDFATSKPAPAHTVLLRKWEVKFSKATELMWCLFTTDDSIKDWTSNVCFWPGYIAGSSIFAWNISLPSYEHACRSMCKWESCEKWYQFVIVTFLYWPSDDHSTLTGCCKYFASYMAGCTVLSGKTRPLIQNWASFGLSPKSPPYAQNSCPSSSCFIRPWSTRSQIKPPCNLLFCLKCNQYLSKLPLLFPMACEYSHNINGLFSFL